MNKVRSYAGIDRFRLIAALLVVAVHTSPLSSFDETGDFILTRVTARVAVPFFFMVSGFFSISKYTQNGEKLKKFVQSTLRIYGIAILLYLPVNLYNHYFSGKELLPKIIKDLIFDGTVYHLWYLPAAALGGAIAFVFLKKLGSYGALAISFFLYLIGLFGDSYYGIAKELPCLDGFYDLIFQVTDYTRNGIFFAPFFFALGAYIADHPAKLTPLQSVCGCMASFALMLIEALMLHSLRLMRHDSMYLFLPVCMFFLFHALLYFPGKRFRPLRTASLLIYLLHPMAIIGVRFAARLFHAQGVLIDNSLIHFLAVSLISSGLGFAGANLWDRRSGRKQAFWPETGRAWVEINLAHLSHNVKMLQRAMSPKCRLMAVVKAEAYGHSAFLVSAHLEKMGVRSFAVATADEGIALRRYGIEGEILILGYTDVRRAKELKKYRLMQTVISFDYACALNQQHIPVNVHIKIDTGMHRLGLPFSDTQNIRELFAMPYLKVCGMYTHLSCSDSLLPEDAAFTKEQIRRFYGAAAFLRRSRIPVPKLHIQSSYGLLNYPELNCDYARIGIALYGVLSTPENNTVQKPELRPALSLKARVAHIQTVREGESVGYGRAFTAKRDSRIAILPVGYADGFPRNLSGGRGCAEFGSKIAPIVGRICMDQLAVDVTEIENISVGDTAVLIDAGSADAVSAAVVAAHAGSISNELLCRMGKRLPVVVG